MDLNEKSLGEFKRVLRSLENTSINLPEIRQLREEQEYLERLREQRTKIQELKARFDEKDGLLKKLQTENVALRKQLEHIDRRLIKAENRLAEEQSKVQKLQSTLYMFETEREKIKLRILELQNEKEEHRKQMKHREVTLMTIEDDVKRRLKEMKESHQAEKKKIVEMYQIRMVEASKPSNLEEIEKMQQLIERQNRALKLQQQSLSDMNSRNQDLQVQLDQVRQIYEKTILCRDQITGEADFYKQQAERLAKKVKQMEEEEDTRRELEMLKEKMNRLRKGEIDKIEEICNDIK